jgi:hypothetical protein
LANESDYSVEADRNVTELTMANSGLDLDVYLKEGQCSPAPSLANSDSGISQDQSPKTDQVSSLRSRHDSSSAYASSNEDEAMLQVHRVEDGTLVINSSGSPSRASPPAVKISPSASMKRAARLKAEADELTVLSQEDVVDTTLIKAKYKTEAMASSGTLTKASEKIPARAYANLPGIDEEEDEDFNKGCYYFVSCLDAFWIL